MCRSFPGNADSLASMALATVGFLLFLQLCIVVFPRWSLRVHRVLIQSRPSLCPSAVSGSHQLKLERLVYKTLTDGPVWMRDIAVGFRFLCEECNGFGPLGFLKKWPLVVSQVFAAWRISGSPTFEMKYFPSLCPVFRGSSLHQQCNAQNSSNLQTSAVSPGFYTNHKQHCWRSQTVGWFKVT